MSGVEEGLFRSAYRLRDNPAVGEADLEATGLGHGFVLDDADRHRVVARDPAAGVSTDR